MDATVTVKSIGKKMSGKVVEISPSSRFTGGQFQIKVIVDADESSALSSGMYVSVSIPTSNTSGTPRLYVPASSIIHRDQLAGLYTIGSDQTAQLRWLKVGRQLDDDVEVLSGLSPGEKFITQSDGRLYNGVPVTVE
jgi:multidrug efflux pump subunit AcrA (membrane-fusion protein)